MKRLSLLGALGLLLVVSAVLAQSYCPPDPPTPTPYPPNPTYTPRPTYTFYPTYTATATNTPLPTATNTITPTATCRPTNTPLPIQPTYTPLPTATYYPTYTPYPITPTPAVGGIYYVAPDGDDDNAGTFLDPWLTIQKGVDTVQPGDTVYVRAGIYFETITIGVSGIVISGYLDERPVIDGEFLRPVETLWSPLVSIGGGDILFEQFEIRNSLGKGIGVDGRWTPERPRFVIIRDVWIHDIVTAGVCVWSADDVTVENCEIGMTNLVNDTSGPYYQANVWMGAVRPKYGRGFIIKGNLIYQSYGECINVHGAAHDVVIEDNIIYDCWGPAVYTPNSWDVLIQRNLIYHTIDPRFLRGETESAGITLAEEPPSTGPGELERITIVNNLVMGYSSNFKIYRDSPDGDVGLKDCLIAHNTFVDAHAESGWCRSINIPPGNHYNSRFENNIILQDDPNCGLARYGGDSGAVIFSHNLWSGTPISEVMSPNDIVGDPELTRAGATVPGELTSDYFKLDSTSPAIDAAKVIEVSLDFFGTLRGNNPDIGAHEY